MTFSETQLRTVGKIVSWRIMLTVINFTYTYIATGNWKAGLAVAGMSAVFNTFIYWAHERFWNWINWGKYAKPDSLDAAEVSDRPSSSDWPSLSSGGMACGYTDCRCNGKL